MPESVMKNFLSKVGFTALGFALIGWAIVLLVLFLELLQKVIHGVGIIISHIPNFLLILVLFALSVAFLSAVVYLIYSSIIACYELGTGFVRFVRRCQEIYNQLKDQ